MKVSELDQEAQEIIRRNYERCGVTERILKEIEDGVKEVNRKYGREVAASDPGVATAMKWALGIVGGKKAERRANIPCASISQSLDEKSFTQFYVPIKK